MIAQREDFLNRLGQTLPLLDNLICTKCASSEKRGHLYRAKRSRLPWHLHLVLAGLTDFSRPWKPTDNAYAESFNATVRL